MVSTRCNGLFDGTALREVEGAVMIHFYSPTPDSAQDTEIVRTRVPEIIPAVDKESASNENGGLLVPDQDDLALLSWNSILQPFANNLAVGFVLDHQAIVGSTGIERHTHDLPANGRSPVRTDRADRCKLVGRELRMSLLRPAPLQREIRQNNDVLWVHHHVVSVERLAVQRSGRRQAGAAILRRCLCGDEISQLKVVKEK